MRDKLTRAEQVRAEAFALATGTVAGKGDRTFHDLFPRAEEIEHWLYQAREPAIIKSKTMPAGNGARHAS